MVDEITSTADEIFSQAEQFPAFGLDPNTVREVGTVTDESLEMPPVWRCGGSA